MDFSAPSPIGPAPKLAPGFDGCIVDLLRLAKAQRLLIWCCLGRLAAEIILLRAAALSRSGPGELLAWIYAVVILATVVMIARVARAYGMNPFAALLISIPLAAPCVGTLVLPLLNDAVTRTLRRAGAPVGFMGVSPAGMHRLLLNGCPYCGYDVRGITLAVCPECGNSLSDSHPAIEPRTD